MQTTSARTQLNVRLSPQVAKLIDDKRIELSQQMGGIPSRSDVLRLALGAFLGVDTSEWEADGRKGPRT